jgi:hypothetical protein
MFAIVLTHFSRVRAKSGFVVFGPGWDAAWDDHGGRDRL